MEIHQQIIDENFLIKASWWFFSEVSEISNNIGHLSLEDYILNQRLLLLTFSKKYNQSQHNNYDENKKMLKI